MTFFGSDGKCNPSRADGSRWAVARLHDTHGFTLVEGIVSLLVVGIVLSAVAYVLVFGANMTNNQEATTNAQTLAATVKSDLEAALQDASSVSMDGNDIKFTTTQTTYYLGNKGSSYVLSIDGEGHVQIESADGSDKGDFIPSSTYIDGDKVSWAKDGRQITVTVESSSGAELAQATTSEVLPQEGADTDAAANDGGAA